MPLYAIKIWCSRVYCFFAFPAALGSEGKLWRRDEHLARRKFFRATRTSTIGGHVLATRQSKASGMSQKSLSTVEKVPRENSNDKCPMWIGDKIYFLSDRNGGVVSLFAFDTKSKAVEQILDRKSVV